MARKHNVVESRHHLWFNASDYEHEWYQQLREKHITTMNHLSHVALHKEVEPPPKPTMGMVADYLDVYDYEQPARGVESFEFALDYFSNYYVRYLGNDEKQDLMLGIAYNIKQQLQFIKPEVEL